MKPEAYLEPSRTSMMEFSAVVAVNYSHKKIPSQMFDWVLNTPLRAHKHYSLRKKRTKQESS